MAFWIWYFGDMELYHHARLHMRRDEFDYQFPPFWRLDDATKNVVFRKEFDLAEDGTIHVAAVGRGMLEVDGQRAPLHSDLTDTANYRLAAGHHVIEAKVMSDELPALYIDGAVSTDGTWDVTCYDGKWVKAGSSWLFRDPLSPPTEFPFRNVPLAIVAQEEIGGGTLFDFGKEYFGEITLCDWQDKPSAGEADAGVYVRYGESREEALSDEAIVQDCFVAPSDNRTIVLDARAFRYVWVACGARSMTVKAEAQLLPVRRRGKFSCSDPLINRIWDTALHTFHLCSREFFLDGIKRDRWVWSGDAYQSYLINRYSFGDREIDRRTILALRGRDPVPSHLNTILDYSFYWLMSLEDYHMATGDTDFILRLWPRAVSLMDYCLARRDENGFAANEGNGWIFIDWADMDKDTCLCAEQMLLLRALEAMANLAELVGEDGSAYRAIFDDLHGKVDAFFWDEEKGAYIDSYASGRRNVTRHANIFALRFGYAGEKRDRILRSVLLNDEVAAIRTPYFKFYELDALCDAGLYDEVLNRIRGYWGPMIEGGATSVWEEFSPDEPMSGQLGMYGDRFGKSLCHAWGASPIYLLGRWFMGVRPTSPGYATFEVRPQLTGMDWFEGTVPVGPWGEVHLRVQNGVCTICSTVPGGTLYWNGKTVPLEKRVAIEVK